VATRGGGGGRKAEHAPFCCFVQSGIAAAGGCRYGWTGCLSGDDLFSQAAEAGWRPAGGTTEAKGATSRVGNLRRPRNSTRVGASKANHPHLMEPGKAHAGADRGRARLCFSSCILWGPARGRGGASGGGWGGGGLGGGVGGGVRVGGGHPWGAGGGGGGGVGARGGGGGGGGPTTGKKKKTKKGRRGVADSGGTSGQGQQGTAPPTFEPMSAAPAGVKEGVREVVARPAHRLGSGARARSVPRDEIPPLNPPPAPSRTPHPPRGGRAPTLIGANHPPSNQPSFSTPPPSLTGQRPLCGAVPRFLRLEALSNRRPPGPHRTRAPSGTSRGPRRGAAGSAWGGGRGRPGCGAGGRGGPHNTRLRTRTEKNGRGWVDGSGNHIRGAENRGSRRPSKWHEEGKTGRRQDIGALKRAGRGGGGESGPSPWRPENGRAPRGANGFHHAPRRTAETAINLGGRPADGRAKTNPPG